MQAVLTRWTVGCRDLAVARRLLWLWPYGGLAALLSLVLWPAWTSTDRLIIGGDTTLAHYPYFVLWRDALAAGELPFWNPYTFSGIPAFPTLQAGYGYPPHWAFSLVEVIPAMNWLIGLHLLLAGLGAAWCAGRLGASRSGQFLSGLAYALGSALVARMSAGHLSFLEADAWLPWAMGLAIQIGRRGTVLYLALVVALMTLAGQPELLIMSAWWLPLWALGSAWGSRSGRLSRVLPQAVCRTVVAIALGVGLAAFQLLPVMELLAVSNRQAEMTRDFATAISLAPWQLPALLAPLLFGDPRSTYWPGPSYHWHELLLYIGVVPLLAAFRSTGWQRRLCLGTAALAIVLACGRYFPTYAWLQDVPGYASFRVPAKHLTLAALALALAAGLGLPRLHGPRVALAAFAVGGLLALVALTIDRWLPVMTGLLGGAGPPGLTRSSEPESMAAARLGVQLPIGLLVGTGLLAFIRPAWCQRGLLALAALDLVLTLQPFRLQLVDPLGIIANAAPLRDQTRVAVVGTGGALLANFGPVIRVVQPAGYNPLFSAEYMTLLTGRANAGVVLNIGRDDDPALHLLGYRVIFDQQKPLTIVVEPPPPLVWVARCVWPGGALQVRAPEFPRESCITRRTATVRDPEVPPGRASIVAEGNGWLRVEAEGPGWLVTVQPWYPGWSGLVDGVPTPVEAVDGALVGLPLPPGPHLISLSYLPAGLLPGLLISALTGLLLLLSWYADRPRPHKRSPTQPPNRPTGPEDRALTAPSPRRPTSDSRPPP